jgi:hypothetical protein
VGGAGLLKVYVDAMLLWAVIERQRMRNPQSQSVSSDQAASMSTARTD